MTRPEKPIGRAVWESGFLFLPLAFALGPSPVPVPVVGVAGGGFGSGSPAPAAPGPSGQASDTLHIARFTSLSPADPPPSEWLPLSFGEKRGETRYRLTRRGDRVCMEGEARAGGSGLLRPMEVDPVATSWIRWSWWVNGSVQGGDLTRKDGDDFPARIYVNFRFEPEKAGALRKIRHRLASGRFGGEAPGRSLVYVWGNRAEEGTVAPSAYTDEAVLIVVKSGDDEVRKWWTEERNVLEDYRDAFGEDPPAIVGFALMTDADDTGAFARACYGDILLFSR